MKKFTKRLTMIVAILLSLVLLSSSIVSTTLAKYVVTKDVTSTVGLEKFGLELKIEAASDLGLTQTSQFGNSITYTCNALKLVPGQKIEDAIKVTVSGKPVVAATLTFDVKIEYNETDAFKTTTEAFGSTVGGKIYMPIVFYVNKAAANTAYDNLAASTLETELEKKLPEKAIGASPKNNITAIVNTFDFEWPKDSDVINSNEIGTWLAEQGHTVSFTLTATLSQS